MNSNVSISSKDEDSLINKYSNMYIHSHTEEKDSLININLKSSFFIQDQTEQMKVPISYYCLETIPADWDDAEKHYVYIVFF